jgi:hypothetical protein
VAQVITTEDLVAGSYTARVYGRYERVEGLRFARSADYDAERPGAQSRRGGLSQPSRWSI